MSFDILSTTPCTHKQALKFKCKDICFKHTLKAPKEQGNLLGQFVTPNLEWSNFGQTILSHTYMHTYYGQYTVHTHSIHLHLKFTYVQATLPKIAADSPKFG